MNEVAIIFPNQLFENVVFSNIKKIYLIEDEHFFTRFKFHKAKLILHRASMKFYFDYLSEKGFDVFYVEFDINWIEILKKNNVKKVHYIDVVDFGLEQKIKSFGFATQLYPTQAFLTPPNEFKDFFKDKTHFSQTSFYINQRKKMKILLEPNGKLKPLMGKWSFDKENRDKLPKDITIPSLIKFDNKYVAQAKSYVEKNFPDNYGYPDNFIFPTTHDEAKLLLRNFLENKLRYFGNYEDAISKDNPFLFHSILSSSLNTGLITPQYVIENTLKFSEGNNISINSLEGFIRQIISWREFIRAVYILKGAEQFNQNYFNHKNRLPRGFYTASTKIDPVDNVIKKVLKTAFTNHIERLMVIGNFCLLTEIHPKEVYKWFMEMFIDSYDWVMIPNVFGMSQYADGGWITTKPYISSSNYILKMSNFEVGAWSEIFDGLYWRFIEKHQALFLSNPRLRIMKNYLNRIDKTKLENYIKIANNYILSGGF